MTTLKFLLLLFSFVALAQDDHKLGKSTKPFQLKDNRDVLNWPLYKALSDPKNGPPSVKEVLLVCQDIVEVDLDNLNLCEAMAFELRTCGITVHVIGEYAEKDRAKRLDELKGKLGEDAPIIFSTHGLVVEGKHKVQVTDAGAKPKLVRADGVIADLRSRFAKNPMVLSTCHAGKSCQECGPSANIMGSCSAETASALLPDVGISIITHTPRLFPTLRALFCSRKVFDAAATKNGVLSATDIEKAFDTQENYHLVNNKYFPLNSEETASDKKRLDDFLFSEKSGCPKADEPFRHCPDKDKKPNDCPKNFESRRVEKKYFTLEIEFDSDKSGKKERLYWRPFLAERDAKAADFTKDENFAEDAAEKKPNCGRFKVPPFALRQNCKAVVVPQVVGRLEAICRTKRPIDQVTGKEEFPCVNPGFSIKASNP